MCTCIEGRLSHCLSFCSSFGEPVYVSFLNQCMNLIMDISSEQNKGRVLLSDVDKVKDLISEFETTMKEFDNSENDYDDIRLYEGWIEGLIIEAKETLSLSE